MSIFSHRCQNAKKLWFTGKLNTRPELCPREPGQFREKVAPGGPENRLSLMSGSQNFFYLFLFPMVRGCKKNQFLWPLEAYLNRLEANSGPPASCFASNWKLVGLFSPTLVLGSNLSANRLEDHSDWPRMGSHGAKWPKNPKYVGERVFCLLLLPSKAMARPAQGRLGRPLRMAVRGSWGQKNEKKIFFSNQSKMARNGPQTLPNIIFCTF